MNERINQAIFALLNPITPPFARRWFVEAIFDDAIPRFLFPLAPAIAGLGLGAMPHRRKDGAS